MATLNPIPYSKNKSNRFVRAARPYKHYIAQKVGPAVQRAPTKAKRVASAPKAPNSINQS